MSHNLFSRMRWIVAFALLGGLLSMTSQLPTSYAAPQKPSKEQEKADKEQAKAAKEAAKEQEKAEKESSKSSSSKSSSSKSSKGGKSKLPANAPTTEGTPALWRDVGEVSQLDLHWGIGSEDLRRVRKRP